MNIRTYTPYSPSDRIRLSPYCRVPGWFINRVYAQVIATLPQLNSACRQTAKRMCGSEMWKSLSRGQRSRAGRCVKILADAGYLPLLLLNPERRGTKFYLVLD